MKFYGITAADTALIVFVFCVALSEALSYEVDTDACPPKQIVDYGPEIGSVESLSGEEDPTCHYVPDSLEQIQTKFYLYTRQYRDGRSWIELDYRNNFTLDTTFFDSDKTTYFIIHGWTESGFTSIYIKIKDAIIAKDDCNVVMVDYHKGAPLEAGSYQAIVNGFVVGKLTFRLIHILHDRRGLDMKKLRFIGFSLGGQIAGQIGRLVIQNLNTSIAIIYVNDPAGQWYRLHPDKCIKKEDGEFVTVIHTNIVDTLGIHNFGLRKPAGHVDFYVNGGRIQPACKQRTWTSVDFKDGFFYACSHLMANHYFLESILDDRKNCFTSFSCSSVLTTDFPDEWEKSRQSCLRENLTSCGRMGFYSHLAPGRGVHYLTTNSRSPFCGNSK